MFDSVDFELSDIVFLNKIAVAFGVMHIVCHTLALLDCVKVIAYFVQQVAPFAKLQVIVVCGCVSVF